MDGGRGSTVPAEMGRHVPEESHDRGDSRYSEVRVVMLDSVESRRCSDGRPEVQDAVIAARYYTRHATRVKGRYPSRKEGSKLK